MPNASHRLAVDTFRVDPSEIVRAGNSSLLINSYALSGPIPNALAAVATLTAAGNASTSSTDIPPREPKVSRSVVATADEDKGGHIPLPRAT